MVGYYQLRFVANSDKYAVCIMGWITLLASELCLSG